MTETICTETICLRPWTDPVIDTLGFHPRSIYCEKFWLPSLGPSRSCGPAGAGHVAAVVVAHDRSLITFRAGQVIRGQYPLLAAMVTFTVGGLLLGH